MNVRPLRLLYLSQAERSDRIDRSDPGEGMNPTDGPYRLTGQLNHSASGRRRP
jgi:hypothetical protein